MKKIMKLLTIFSLIFVLTGCMKMNMNIEVSKDLKMNMNVEMLMQESFLSTINMTKDEFFQTMEKEVSSEMNGAQIEPIEKTIAGQTWIGLVAKANHVDDDVQDMLKKDGNMMTLTLPLEELQDVDELEDMDYSLQDLKNTGVEMNVSIKMPGKVSSNVGNVDGDTVTIDLIELMSQDHQLDQIVVTCDLSKSQFVNQVWIYVVSGLGILVFIVILIFIIKNKKKNLFIEANQQNDISFCPHCGTKLDGEIICPHCHQDVHQ